MDYLIYADGSFEAIEEIEIISEVITNIRNSGAVRMVWKSKVFPNKWLQMRPQDVHGGVDADDVPDEVKLAAMLE